MQISPKEKRRLERLMANVNYLANRQKYLDNTQIFIMYQQTKAILKILGCEDRHINRILVGDAIDILSGVGFFRKRKLRKLIKKRC